MATSASARSLSSDIAFYVKKKEKFSRTTSRVDSFPQVTSRELKNKNTISELKILPIAS